MRFCRREILRQAHANIGARRQLIRVRRNIVDHPVVGIPGALRQRRVRRGPGNRGDHPVIRIAGLRRRHGRLRRRHRNRCGRFGLGSHNRRRHILVRLDRVIRRRMRHSGVLILSLILLRWLVLRRRRRLRHARSRSNRQLATTASSGESSRDVHERSLLAGHAARRGPALRALSSEPASRAFVAIGGGTRDPRQSRSWSIRGPVLLTSVSWRAGARHRFANVCEPRRLPRCATGERMLMLALCARAAGCAAISPRPGRTASVQRAGTSAPPSARAIPRWYADPGG